MKAISIALHNKFLIPHARAAALIAGLVANTLWATSFVLVKISLREMGPLTIGGLRYFMAFLILLPFMKRKHNRTSAPGNRLWLRLTAAGISAFTIGNGATFWGLQYIDPTTASLLMSTLPILMLLFGAVLLAEIPTPRQIFGVVLCLLGGLLFFSPGLNPEEPVGIAIMVLGLVAFGVFTLLGRGLARERSVDTLTLTAVPLAIGGGMLLLLALSVEGLPKATAQPWLIVTWLAVVNTAVAYILYNYSLQSLTALEMSVLFNLSPIGTALLAWVLLGDRLITVQIVGMLVVIVGTFLAQQLNRPRRLKTMKWRNI